MTEEQFEAAPEWEASNRTWLELKYARYADFQVTGSV